MEVSDRLPEWKHDLNMCDLTKSHVLRRIGSDSFNALIFHVDIDGREMACKVVPITEEFMNSKIMDEITMTYYLGEKYPQYFPKIYGYTYCNHIVIPEYMTYEGSYYNAVNYQYELYAEKYGIIDIHRQIPDIVRNLSVPGYLLFMELGYMDLKYWMERYHTFEEYKQVLLRCIKIAKILGDEKIRHRDLHSGNILFMNKSIDSIKVIDFGQSIYDTNPENKTIFIFDMTYLLGNIIREARKNRNVDKETIIFLDKLRDIRFKKLEDMEEYIIKYQT